MQSAKILKLNEADFIIALQAMLLQGASEGDVIPLMIQYNVPLYVLKQIWPAKENELRGTSIRLAFAVAEDGWQGKVANLQSQLIAPISKHSETQYKLNFKKSYVIECDAMLVLACYQDGLAACFVKRDESLQLWQSRAEHDMQLPLRAGGFIDHFRVQAQQDLDRGEFHPISQKAYARLGIQIPLREASSLSLLALAIMRRAGLDTDHLNSQAEALIHARTRGRLKRSEMTMARIILNYFYESIENRSLSVHPFWLRTKGLLGFIPA